MTKWLAVVRDLTLIAVVVVIAFYAARWLTAPTVDAGQAREINSLREINVTLDSALTIATVKADSAQRAMRLRARRDSTISARSLDSLEALIPDTATMVPRPIHEAIVARKDSTIALFYTLYHTADSGWTDARNRLAEFQRQNTALLAQVNDLEKKANPGLFRRAKYAAPFVGGLYLACKVGAIRCD